MMYICPDMCYLYSFYIISLCFLPRSRYLGDLKEATDFELLQDRKITAVLNLINWWELSSRLPEAPLVASQQGLGKA